jgi:hypothetical protein
LARARLVSSRVVALVLSVATCIAWPSPAAADDVILSGMTWMTGYPATWNAGAPKVVFDGLHTYAVLCGYQGSANNCSVARRRDTEAWTSPGRLFRADQPPVMIIDRRGRLNVFYNDPILHHLRFDNPSVDLVNGLELFVGVSVPVGYLHASYDAATDAIFLAGNETTGWTTYASVNIAGRGWTPPAAMPGPDPNGSMYLYARTLYARGRYFVLTGEHPRAGSNASYTAAVLFESPTPTGPWSARVLHRVSGANIGVPYQNWVIPTDLQADAAGNVRAIMHIVESGSGHVPLPEGLHISREEDGYALRHVASGIDDGFALVVHPSGVHLAFALVLSDRRYAEAGNLVVFRSDDGGVSWRPPQAIVRGNSLNPVPLDPRNGSMSLPTSVPFIYSAPILSQASVASSAGYEVSASIADGDFQNTRVMTDSGSARSYRVDRSLAADGTFRLSYQYRAGDYWQTYVADSAGGFEYRTSDGYQTSSRRR